MADIDSTAQPAEAQPEALTAPETAATPPAGPEIVDPAAVPASSDTVVLDKADLMMNLADLSQGTIQLMGLSFILGSLVTILILILLDFMRRNKT